MIDDKKVNLIVVFIQLIIWIYIAVTLMIYETYKISHLISFILLLFTYIIIIIRYIKNKRSNR
ncbi:hypothetical protein GOQ27_14420 [Clostridium sp. D2Q-11]|uniref:Uncharacterized protein n=1 Tax=Anaeromonas frigoriresistens TaxID=2683708 RepID=A0A942UXZ7_9FIRM|nr:hypothetical protein [Anaeromonas frigoriresistens]MBS4539665.1 hypothetical protein [Anaeromonas frigoriresistens]